MTTSLCPVCSLEVNKLQGVVIDRQLRHIVDCLRCGSYQITDTSVKYLQYHLKSETKNILLSHAIHKMQKNAGEDYPFLTHDQVLKILDNPHPKPSEQLNNFILWLGEEAPILSKKTKVDAKIIQAELAAVSENGVRSIINHLHQKNIVEGDAIGGTWELAPAYELALTIDGWELYEKLKQGSLSSRKAFMAMQYRDQELDAIVTNYFRPAVKATGFELYRLDDKLVAGLIDDRLRVEIRTSRFLIADLTHENRGAYWEAGFAEGLGKPVIYTCEKSKFEKLNTHFDTNHHTTVLWDKSDLEKAAIDLKNTIRATLPEDTKLSDNE